MFTRPLFTPTTGESAPPPPARGAAVPENVHAYEFSDQRVVAAVNVAMAAGRPLLVTGPPGAGKSSLARAVATQLGWTYVEHVFTSRTELADLTCGVDMVRRLADAQVQRLLPDWAYLQPGVLWWAFDPDSAVSRGHDLHRELKAEQRELLPDPLDPRVLTTGCSANTVVLLDEIDKAEPDVPNDLLEPLGAGVFSVRDGFQVTAGHDVLVVITSNGERRLPPAFLRRCAQLHLAPDSMAFFVAVATTHFGTGLKQLYEDVAVDFNRLRLAARQLGRREPSTAEYLDTLRACLRLDVRPGTPGWEAIIETALWKDPALPDEVDHDLVG